MKRLCILALCCLMTACSAVQGDTPLQRYIGLQLDYQNWQTVAVAYKTACAKTLPTHPCHQDVVTIKAISSRVQGTFDAAETARKFGIGADFAASVAIASTALSELATYLLHTTEVK